MSRLFNLFTTLNKVKERVPFVSTYRLVYLRPTTCTLRTWLRRYSVFSYINIQSSNCSLNAEKNRHTLYYPTFSIKAKLNNDVHVNITPWSDLYIQPDFSTDQTMMVNQHHKTLRTINKKVYREQKSIIITLSIINILLIRQHYSSHEMTIRSTRVSLPLKYITTKRKP